MIMLIRASISLIVLWLPICLSELDKELGQACTGHGDCAIAYSRCGSDKKCSCMDGFKQDKASGLCQSGALACPTHDKSVTVKPNKLCVQRFNETTGETKNNCSGSDTCIVHPYVKTVEGHEVGSCCPDPPKDVAVIAVCPVGPANVKGTCPDYSNLPADAPAPADRPRTCSYSDEECVWFKGVSVCCSRPCLGVSSYFSINGRCYDTAAIGQPCTHDGQCAGRSFCLPRGKTGKKFCQCKTKIIPNHFPEYCQ